jgi:colicin import membrane protein
MTTEATDTIIGEIMGAAATTTVAEYRATEAGLAALREQYAAVPDVTTREGMELAREARRNCVSLRTALEAKRKELKAPLLERGKLIDDEAKRIIGAIVEVENPHDKAIKAEEARIEARREAARKERERAAAASQAVIDNLRDIPLRLLDSPAADIAAAINDLVETDVDNIGDLLADDQGRAQQAKEAAIERLRTMHSARAEADRVQAEQAAERKRLADERARLDREQQEQMARDQAERRRRDAIESRIRALHHIGLLLTTSADLRQVQETLLGITLTADDFGDRLTEAEDAFAQAKDRIKRQLEMALEGERAAAEQADRERQLQEREAEAERQRQAREQADAAERERARREAEQEAIDKATLLEAASEALTFLRIEWRPHPEGPDSHIDIVDLIVRKLDAAIARAGDPAQAVQS